MQKESLSFFETNGFYSFLSTGAEWYAYCHTKKASYNSYHVFHLIDPIYGAEKFWVKDGEVFCSLHSLLKAYPRLKDIAVDN